MRQLASFLLVALAVPAVAADAWRWKDEQGVVHYSDRPVPGAERVILPPGARPDPTGQSIAPNAVLPMAPAPVPAAPPDPVKFRYSECTVEAPGNDQVFNAVNTVTVSLAVAPALRSDHLVQLVLDGNVYGAWPPRMLVAKINEIHRGTHTLRMLVLDADKQPLCESPQISFHVRQPSILSPARKPPAKP